MTATRTPTDARADTNGPRQTSERPAVSAHIEPYARNCSTYGNHGCRCEDCTADAARAAREYRRRAPKAVRRRANAVTTRTFNRNNDLSVANASRHFTHWTPQDLAIARDRTLSVRQAAAILGRSMNSVKHMRRGTR